MIQLLVVDDEPIFRQGFVTLLAMEVDFEIIGQAEHGQAAVALAEQLQPEIILMDVRMPVCNGVVATREILQRFPWMKILMLTTFDEDEYIWESLQAGALGYLLKNTPSRQVANAIRMLHQGLTSLGPTIAPRVFAQIQPPGTQKINLHQQFTKRELEVLQLVGQGKSNREIAQLLYLTEGTVKKHLSRILSQLKLRDRTQAALWAHKHLIG